MDNKKDLIEKIKFVWSLWSGKDNSKYTYCNMFVSDLMIFLFDYKYFKGFLANDIHGLLESGDEWEEISHEKLISDDFVSTRNHSIIIASQQAKPHGHLVVLVPGNLVYSGKWDKYVPLCANIGKNNFFEKGVSFAFKDEPQYFLYVKGE